MRVLVLGGTGFIGSHLVDALALRGDDVMVVGREPRLADVHRHDQGLYPGRVSFHYGNSGDMAFITPLLEAAEVILHLVSSTIPATSNQDPVADIESNLVATVRMLEVLRTMPTKKLIYFSSGGTVYGTPQTIPIPEQHPLDPKNSYGIIKVAIEKYLHMYGELYGMPSTILRLANPYGPRQMKIGVQGFIATVLMSILRQKTITIWGDGRVVRDYIYIDDVTRLALQVMDAPVAKSPAMTYNAGSGDGYSLRDILRVAEAISGCVPDVVYQPSRNFDIPAVILDIHQVERDFAWRPEISIEQGMLKYWQWLQQA